MIISVIVLITCSKGALGSVGTVSINPAKWQIVLSPGATGTDLFTFDFRGSVKGSLSLSVSGLPSGVSASWSSDSVTSATVSDTLTLTASATAPIGESAITINALGVGVAATRIVFIEVPGVVPSFIGSKLNMSSAGTAETFLGIKPVGYATGPATPSAVSISVTSGLPAGITASFGPPQISASGESRWKLALKGGSSVLAGKSNIEFAVQMTDAKTGTVYTSNQSIPLTLSLSTPSLKFSAASPQLTVVPGKTVTDVFTFTGGGSFNGPITPSVSGLPTGVTATWSSNPVTLTSTNGSSTLTLSAGPSASLVRSNFVVTATGDGISASQTMGLQVPGIKLFAPALVKMQSAGTTSVVINVAPMGGATAPVSPAAASLSLSAPLPAGITSSIGPAQILPTGQTSWTMTLNGSATAVAGDTSLNFAVQMTDATTGAFYTSNQSIPLTVSLSTPSLKFSASSPQLTVVPGQSISDVFTFTGGGSFNGPITPSVSGVPTGVTATWSSNPVLLSSNTATSTLTLSVATSAPLNRSYFVVTATGDGINASQTLNLQVPGVVISARPFVKMQSADSFTLVVNAVPMGGANGPLNPAAASLSVSAPLPAGITCSIGPAQVSPSGQTSWTVTLNGSSTAIASETVLNLFAQVTDARTGAVYSGKQSVPLSVSLSTPSLKLSADSTQVIFMPGQTVTDLLTFTGGGSFTGPITPSISGLPNGVTATWSNNPVTLTPSTGSSILTLAASPAVPVGLATVVVTATGDGINASQTLNLQVPGIVISARPFVKMQSADSFTLVVNAVPMGGANGPLNPAAASLSVSAPLPAGITCSIGPAQVSPSGQTSWTVTLNGSSTAIASETVLNLFAQVTDAKTGAVYSGKQSVPLSVSLSTPSLLVSQASSLIRLLQGQTSTDSFTFSGKGSFNGPINLTVAGLPSGLSASWSSNPILVDSSSCTSTLTLVSGSIAPVGTFQIIVTATGDGLTVTRTLNVTVAYPAGILLYTKTPNLTMQTASKVTFSVFANPVGGAQGPTSASNVKLNLLSGLPAGVSTTFGAPHVYAGGVVAWTITLAGTSSSQVGSSILNLAAQASDPNSGASYSADIKIPLTVQASIPTLVFQPNPSAMTATQGSAVSVPFTFSGGNYFTGPVTLTISGLPDGVTALWSSNPLLMGSASRTDTLTLTTSPSTPPGSTTIIVTANGANVSAVSSLILQVTPVALSFAFTISDPQTHTSAGVYNSAGGLIKTLWSNNPYSPGTYTGGWDGTTDAGSQALPNDVYTVKLLTNNVSYHWDGVIGSTSEEWFARQRLESFAWNGNWRMAFVGNRAWFTTGYAEGANMNFGYFDDKDPNRPNMINPANDLLPAGAVSTIYYNQNLALVDIATDGQWVYLAEMPYWTGTLSYVTAFDVTSGDPNTAIPAVFGNGTATSGPTCPNFPVQQCGLVQGNTSWFNTTLSYVDGEPVGQQPPTGIAVQKSGPVLAVAHGDYSSSGVSFMGTNRTLHRSNEIRLFNKRQGTSLGIITAIPNPTQLAFNSNGLWVISNDTLYLVTDPGGANSVSQPSLTLSHPVSVATNGSTDHLFVLDGGSSQQMKEYDSSLKLVASYGVNGGYNDCNPTVRNDHLLLDETAVKGVGMSNGSWIKVEESTGDVWIQEGGMRSRILHLAAHASANGQTTYSYANQIQFEHPNYQLGVSETMPTRVFAGLFEYSVSYDPQTPLQAGDPDPVVNGNGAWSLVKNWAVCADGGGGSPSVGMTYPNVKGDIKGAEKLSNGHVYAEVSAGSSMYVYELPSNESAPMRLTTTVFKNWQWKRLFRDGSLGWGGSGGQLPSNSETVYTAAPPAFDSQNNPHWSGQTPVATLKLDGSALPLLDSGWGSPISGIWPTTGGYYPIYQPGRLFNSLQTTDYPI